MSATEHPFFRTDLVSRPVDAAGHRLIEVTDPDSGRSFRFYEVEYAIACAMDGERGLGELVDWAKIELGLEPSADELRTVIGTLADLGYLDTGDQAQALPPPPLPGRLADSAARPPDLSMDLSEHIPVRAADVKEAVRQSRAMQAIPSGAASERSGVTESDDAFDEEKTPAPMRPVRMPAAAAAADNGLGGGSRAEPPPVPSAALGKTLLGMQAPLPPGQAGRTPPPPMVLPDQPADISSTAPTQLNPVLQAASAGQPARQFGSARDVGVQPVLPARRSAGILPYIIVLLLLLAAGAGAYWWFFLREGGRGADAEGAASAAPSVVADDPARPATAEPPPSSKEIVATLESGPTQEQMVLAPRLGQVVWLAAPGSEVSEGAAVAKFDGYLRWDLAVKDAQESQRRYQARLDQANASGDQAAAKEAEANIRRKQADIERNQAELDKFLISAPIGGLVEPSVKQRAQVKKDEPVAKILAQSEPRATFPLPLGTMLEGSDVRVVARSDVSLAATCKILESSEGRVVVSCPTDSGLASGAEVLLKLQ